MLSRDPRNAGIAVWVHYQYGINPQRLVIDLRGIPGEKSRVDVFRVLLQCAATQKGKGYGQVILSSAGTPKLLIPGEYFRTLGEEYEYQNPVYTMCTFPYQITDLNGEPLFVQPEGGILYVLEQQLKDFAEVHDRWYVRDTVPGE